MPNTPVLSNAEIARYSRHLILDEVGMSGQKLAAKVLCVGTGGLGSPTPMYLQPLASEESNHRF